MKRNRYTIHIYGDHHFAVDCETCGGKVANMYAGGHTTGEVMDRINQHERKYHPREE